MLLHKTQPHPRKEHEGDDIKKIELDCAAVNAKLKQLQGEVTLGKTKWPDATQPEVRLYFLEFRLKNTLSGTIKIKKLFGLQNTLSSH